ncbi:prophage antirepressor protein [Microbacterium sp. HM58-2]|nr:prophage antirepressor protein [Microbacterium sp. HM58-2]
MTMSALEVFQYNGGDVRTLLIDGEPWFSAVDVCVVLGIGNPSDAVRRLDADEYTLVSIEGGRSLNVVSEAGLFALILGSRKPEARAFKRWVTHEVLPSIRRTGAYAVPETRESLLARAVLEANAAIAEAHEQIEALAPRAEAWDEIADAGTDYAVRDAAPMLARAGIETGPQRLFEALAAMRWIYRGEKRRWTPYAHIVDAGYLTVRAMPPYRDRDSGDLMPAAPQVRITPKGLERLRVRLGTGVLTA